MIATNVFQISDESATMRCHQVHMKEHHQAAWSQKAEMALESKSARAGTEVTSHGFDLTMRIVQHMHEAHVLWSVLWVSADKA